MSFEINQVTTRKELKEFIFLPEKIHKNHKGWVPPIYYQERRYFNPTKNRALSYSDYILALGFMNGKPVARIMGIINRRCNEFKNEKNARFGLLECPDDQTIVHQLLSYVEDWARDRGMTKIVGPMGFNNQDSSGFLIQGYEYQPTFNTYFNYEYIHQLMENEKYSKEIDYVTYRVEIPAEMPEFYSKIYNRTITKGNYKVHEFNKRKEIKPFIIPILELMNECFAELYGFQPLDDEEKQSLAKKFLRFLDPRFVKVVTKANEVIGFNIAMPHLSDGIKKAKGRLFPLGIFFILRAAKKTKQLDSLIGGIKKEYRGRGIDVLIGYTTILSAQKAGLKIADSHHEMENNVSVRAEMDKLKGEVYKRFRIYKKEL